jgi:hypothetical protein
MQNTAPNTAQITWCGGGTGNTLVKVQGSITGWGIQGLTLHCNTQVNGTGLLVLAGFVGNVTSLQVSECQNAIVLQSIGNPSDGSNGDTQQNYFNLIDISLFTLSSGTGIALKSESATPVTNCSFNQFHNVFMNVVSTAAFTGIYLPGGDDSNIFDTITIAAPNASSRGVVFDYTQTNTGWPASDVFLRPALGGVAPGQQWVTIGSPTTHEAAPNYVYFADTTNGNQYPQSVSTVNPIETLPPGANLTGQTASVGLTNLTNTTLPGAGFWRACGEMIVTTTGVGGATLGFTFSWFDADLSSGVSKTPVTGLATNANNHNDACVTMYAGGSTNIQYSTTVTGTMGAAQYAFRARLEKFQ